MFVSEMRRNRDQRSTFTVVVDDVLQVFVTHLLRFCNLRETNQAKNVNYEARTHHRIFHVDTLTRVAVN